MAVFTATAEKHNRVSAKMTARNVLDLTVLRTAVNIDSNLQGSIQGWEADPDTFLIITVS